MRDLRPEVYSTPEEIAEFLGRAIANGVTVLTTAEIQGLVLDLVRAHDKILTQPVREVVAVIERDEALKKSGRAKLLVGPLRAALMRVESRL